MADLVTQAINEVVVSPTSVASRVTQAINEVAVSPTNQNARISQAINEVAVYPTNQNARVTQLVWEVVFSNVSLGRLPGGSAPLISPRAGSSLNRIVTGSPKQQSA